MNRLKKELIKAGIIYEADEIKAMYYGAEYDNNARLFAIDRNFIIVKFTSAVLDPQFRLYDSRTLEFIGLQNCYPEQDSFTDAHDRWWSWGNVEVQDDDLGIPLEEMDDYDDYDEETNAEFMAGMTWDDIYGI